MTKKIQVVLMYVGIIFSIYACSSPEAYNKDNIASDGISGIRPPEGCEIVYDMDKFEKVTDDQAYNSSTDMEKDIFYDVKSADTGDIIYMFSNRSLLTYFDKKTGSRGLLCSKPDCEHNSSECNAYIDKALGIQYYDGYIYVVTSASFELIKVSLDGTERESMGSLISKGSGSFISWTIHRGYVYYYYICDGSSTEDTYYINNSNCIFRKSLDKDSEPECIIPMPNMSEAIMCKPIGTGSYVYMLIPNENEEIGMLYRYNIETGKLECFKEWGDNISGMIIRDNEIYYCEQIENENRSVIYCYNIETGEKNIFLETDNLIVNLKYDNDFIYITEKNTEDESITIGIWNYKCERLADMPNLLEEDRMGTLTGSDEKKIYIWYAVMPASEEEAYYETIEYIEKEDIPDGEYEIKEWSEIAGQGE